MTTSPRISVVCVLPDGARARAHALTAEFAHAPGIELILVDHGDPARPALDVPGATVVRSAVLGLPAAFAAGVRAARGAFIAHRTPESVGIPGALGAAADALEARPSAWLHCSGYQLFGTGGAVVHAVSPEQDGDRPPPAFESGLLFRRSAAESLSTTVGSPVFIEALVRARAEGAVIYGDAGFQFPFDSFALGRFDHHRNLHIHSLRDLSYDSGSPWLSIVLAADCLDHARATLERLCTQVMPRGSFELVVADRSGDGQLAEQIDTAAGLAPLRAVRVPGASRGAALNAAVDAAAGEALLFLAEDATPFPDLVEQHARAQRSMAPREVVVLGTWESPAAELVHTLARVLDTSDLVAGRDGMVGGQFQDGARLHTANLSMPRDVYLRAGGMDASIADAHIDADLGLRLEALGYRPYYHEAARVLRGPGPDLDALRAQRIAAARGLVGFYQKHPEAVEGTSLADSTISELESTIEDNAPTVQPVSSAAAALASLAVAPLEQVGSDWRAFADDCVDRLDKLLRHLDVLWRATGLSEGLAAAGLDGIPALLASCPREVPGARSERILLVPHSEAEDAWMLTVARYMAGFGRDEDSTLVVLTDENAGVPASVVRDVCNLLSTTLRPSPQGAWPHILLVDRGTLGGSLLRFVAGMTHWAPAGGPEEERIRAVVVQCGITEVDTAPWEGRAYGGTNPTALRTNSPIRILSWPDWSKPEELTLLMQIAGAALADRPDATLCLRWDESDGDPDPALAALADAYDAVIGAERSLDVLLVEQELTEKDLPALGLAVDAFISLPSSRSGPRADFASGLGATQVATPDALQERVGAVAARNPGPVVPGQVYIA